MKIPYLIVHFKAQARGKSAPRRAAAHFSEKAMVDAWEQVLRG